MAMALGKKAGGGFQAQLDNARKMFVEFKPLEKNVEIAPGNRVSYKVAAELLTEMNDKVAEGKYPLAKENMGYDARRLARIVWIRYGDAYTALTSSKKEYAKVAPYLRLPNPPSERAVFLQMQEMFGLFIKICDQAIGAGRGKGKE